MHSIDGTPKNVTITIHGKNDLPVITGNVHSKANYNPSQYEYTINGKLHITDVDTSDNPPKFYSRKLPWQPWFYAFKQKWPFSYLADANQSDLLNEFTIKHHVTDVISVQANDGTMKNISVMLERPENLAYQVTKALTPKTNFAIKNTRY